MYRTETLLCLQARPWDASLAAKVATLRDAMGAVQRASGPPSPSPLPVAGSQADRTCGSVGPAYSAGHGVGGGGGEDHAQSKNSGNAVQRELARLRLREGVWQKKLMEQQVMTDKAEATAEEALATAAAASTARASAEEALRAVRLQLGEALERLSEARHAAELANEGAEEARRRGQAAVAEVAESQARSSSLSPRPKMASARHAATQSSLRLLFSRRVLAGPENGKPPPQSGTMPRRLVAASWRSRVRRTRRRGVRQRPRLS